MNIIIVTARDNLEAICRQIQPELWGDDNEMTGYQPDQLRRYLDNGGRLLLAKAGKTIIGVALCYVLYHPAGEDSLYVHELDTHPAYRRQGVATALMHRASELAVELELEEVWVGTEQSNKAANALYASLDPSEIEPATVYSYRV